MFLFKDSIKLFLLHHFLIYALWFLLQNDWFWHNFQSLHNEEFNLVQMYTIGTLYCYRNMILVTNSTYFQFCAVDFHNSKFFRRLTIWCTCVLKINIKYAHLNGLENNEIVQFWILINVYTWLTWDSQQIFGPLVGTHTLIHKHSTLRPPDSTGA